jgi:hypothetical protein
VANVNPEVLDMVVRALQKDPNLRSTDLQERATEIDKSIGSLSGRQFHARYGLQARKRLAGSNRSRKGRKKASAKAGRKTGRKPGRKAVGRRPAGRKTGARKKAGRRTARRKAPQKRGRRTKSQRGATDPVREVLTDSYREKRDALETAMDRAFERSIKGDSVQGINELLSSIERGIRDFESA